MKKRAILIIFIFSLLLVNSVSATNFSEKFENVIDKYFKNVLTGAAWWRSKPSCSSDSDGDDIFTRGYVIRGENKKYDYCAVRSGWAGWLGSSYSETDRCQGYMCYVNEYLCEDSKLSSRKVQCESCKDGACYQYCTDSEPEQDLYNEGSVTFKGKEYADQCIIYSRHHKQSGPPTIKFWPSDKCERMDVGSFWKIGYGITESGFFSNIREAAGEYEFSCFVKQSYCDENELKSVTKGCRGGCENGKCLPLKIAIVEVLDEDTNYKLHDASGNRYSYFNILNDKDKKEIILEDEEGKELKLYSYYKILDWYEKEFERYGLNVPIELTVYGPYKTSAIPPLVFPSLRYESGINLVTEALKGLKKEYKEYREERLLYESYFTREALKNNLDLSDYDLISYNYFSNRYSFRGFAARLSFKDSYLSFPVPLTLGEAGQSNIWTLFATIHESIHKLGSSDYYDVDASFEGRPVTCIPGGVVEPNKRPIFPQYQACAMCGLLHLDYFGISIPNDLNDYKLCPAAAIEIGGSLKKSIRCYNDLDCGKPLVYYKDNIAYIDEIKCRKPSTTRSYCSFIPKEIERKCVDPDFTLNPPYGDFYTKSEVTLYEGFSGLSDSCMEDSTGYGEGIEEGDYVGEYYCVDNNKNIARYSYRCPNDCKDGACVGDAPELEPTCVDECSVEGEKECGFLSNYFKVCGNYDSDECLEWMGGQCEVGEECVNGECVSISYVPTKPWRG